DASVSLESPWVNSSPQFLCVSGELSVPLMGRREQTPRPFGQKRPAGRTGNFTPSAVYTHLSWLVIYVRIREAALLRGQRSPSASFLTMRSPLPANASRRMQSSAGWGLPGKAEQRGEPI